MAPVAPHIAEELWARLGRPYSIHQQPWPAFDPAALVTDEITLVVQVNGKVRDRIPVAAEIGEEEARRRPWPVEAVQRHLEGKAAAASDVRAGAAGQYRRVGGAAGRTW